MGPISKFTIAKNLYETGEYQESLENVIEFLEQEPYNKKALKLKADVCTVVGKLPETIQANELLLSLYGGTDEFWEKCYSLERIGSAYWRLKNPDLAIAYYQRALEEYELYYELYYGLGEDKFSEPIILTLLTIGEYQTKSGKLSNAIITHEKLLQFYSKHGPLEGIANSFYEIGLLLYQQNNLDKALTKFLRAVNIHESLRELLSCGHGHYYLGCIFFLRREFKRALVHFNSSIAYLERFYGRIYDEASTDDDPFYRRAVRLRDSLRKNFSS